MTIGTDAHRPLDVGLVAPDALAPLTEHVILAADLVDVTADVPGVRIARDRGQRLALAATADDQRQAALHRWRSLTTPSAA